MITCISLLQEIQLLAIFCFLENVGISSGLECASEFYAGELVARSSSSPVEGGGRKLRFTDNNMRRKKLHHNREKNRRFGSWYSPSLLRNRLLFWIGIVLVFQGIIWYQKERIESIFGSTIPPHPQEVDLVTSPETRKHNKFSPTIHSKDRLNQDKENDVVTTSLKRIQQNTKVNEDRLNQDNENVIPIPESNTQKNMTPGQSLHFTTTAGIKTFARLLSDVTSLEGWEGLVPYVKNVQIGSFCLGWEDTSHEVSDLWWTHHPDWMIFNETEDGYCFRPHPDELQREYMTTIYQHQFQYHSSSSSSTTSRNNCSNVFITRMWSSGGQPIFSILFIVFNMP